MALKATTLFIRRHVFTSSDLHIVIKLLIFAWSASAARPRDAQSLLLAAVSGQVWQPPPPPPHPISCSSPCWMCDYSWVSPLVGFHTDHCVARLQQRLWRAAESFKRLISFSSGRAADSRGGWWLFITQRHPGGVTLPEAQGVRGVGSACSWISICSRLNQ